MDFFADTSIRDSAGKTAIDYYANNDSIRQALCANTAEKRVERFIEAAKSGNLAFVQGYLDAYVGQPEVIRTVETALFAAIINNHLAIVKVLLEVPGIDVNARVASFDFTPLILAAYYHDNDNWSWQQIMPTLLARPNIDRNAKDSIYQRNALHWAALRGKRLALISLLKDPKVDIHAVDIAGNTPLLLSAGMRDNYAPDILDTMLSFSAMQINTTNRAGHTALIEAAISGSRSSVETLINHGADQTIKDRNGKTAKAHANPLFSFTPQLQTFHRAAKANNWFVIQRYIDMVAKLGTLNVRFGDDRINYPELNLSSEFLSITYTDC